MTRIRQETRLDLDKRDLLTLCGGEPQTLYCDRGEVWITFDGRQEDVILKAGERFELDGHPGTVLSALQPATTLRLAARRPHGIACRLDPERIPWASVRRLRWRFPALAALPAWQLR